MFNLKKEMEENLRQEKEKLEKEAKGFENSPWLFFVRKSKLTYLVIIFLLIFGISTIKTLPKELNPEVEIPIAIVITAYPGASPSDVEDQITDKIESQVGDLEGTKKITSTSSLGVSSIVVEFEAGQDLNTSVRKLKDKVNEVTDLPDDATTPSVKEINLNDQPIITAAISGANYDLTELKNFAEKLKDNIKGVPFVSDVVVVGGVEKQINIDINSAKLSAYGFSLNQIIGAISANNVDFPIGSIELDNSNYSVRMSGQLKNAQELSMLQMGENNGAPIYLEDIAKVEDAFEKVTSKSRISSNGDEALDAVSLQVYKRTGGDIIKVAQQAKAEIESARGGDYPEDANVTITLDLSEMINESINTLSTNGIQTVVLILVLLFFFLGLKEALIAGLSVPFSFFVAFITMSLFGESLNFISLFSLVLALGLLVDSAVVIVEGMYEKVAVFGLSGFQSAVLTIKEYAAPLLSGMLTTIGAFVPLLFVIGIFGQFIKTIPVVVISTLTAALFVSLTIIPAIGALVMKPIREGEEKKGRLGKLLAKIRSGLFQKICRKISFICKSKPRGKRTATKVFEKISREYCAFIPKVISTKKQRVRAIAGVWILLIVSFALPVTGILKMQSFVPNDAEFFFINLKMPNGTVLEKTDEVVRKIENIVKEESEMDNFVTSVGAGLGSASGISGGNSSSSSNVAFLQVNLTKKDDRDEKSFEISSRMRKILEREITEGEIVIEEQQSGPPTGAAVEARIEGEDLLILSQIALNLKEELAKIPTVIDAKTSINQTSGEFVFIPNKKIIAENGLSIAQLGLEIRNGVNRNGDENIKKEGDEILINIGLEEESLKSIEGIKDISIVTPKGKNMSVSELGRIEFQPSLASIEHYDKERMISVTGGTDGGNPTEITNAFKEKIAQMDIPSGYRVDFGGESQELQEVFMDMFTKMIIGIILILFILIIQFNSYRQVLIILFTIPLAMIGVIWGMTLARLTVDIPSFIGIVSLAGIVVNNAIILIDEINRELSGGKYVIDAVVNAGRVRLRPVLLTTITTVFGLLPLSITQPDWRNMGFTIIFGLTFAMFLTLVIIPTLYVSFYKGKLREENL
jgi:HAE1 family hydrophobic/amphiphilic exporter-1